MKVALLGSTGLLGQDLLKAVPASIELIPLPRQADLANPTLLEESLRSITPDVVINTAAYNDVDGAETQSTLAQTINAEGPRHLARISSQLNAVLIQFSTDYVFSDAQDHPFTEEDLPSPLGSYGRSKWEGEKAVSKWERHYILRTSALYGLGRKNHATRVLEALRTGGKISLASDLFCSPTFTGDLARWVVQLLDKKPPYGVYHLCHRGATSRYRFAERLCLEVGADLPYPIQTCLLKDLKLPAPRPQRPLLSIDKWERQMGPLPEWGDGLKRFLKIAI